jgi:hypothetical protein
MKKLFFIAIVMVMAVFSSCLKEEEPAGNVPEKEGMPVTVSFTGDHAPALKSSMNFVEAEEWEKELKRITVVAFKQNGECILKRDFTPEELVARKATFTLPSVFSGDLVKFHAVANIALPAKINNLSELEALMHIRLSLYNSSRYEYVSTRSMWGDGFGMSGQEEKIMAQEGQKTFVEISLKRLVAKIRVKINVTEEFNRKYKGYILMWGTDIINSSTLTRIVEKDEPLDAGRTVAGYIYQDYYRVAPDSYINLFYIYENGRRTAQDKVKLRIRGTYNEEGLKINALLQTYIIDLDLDPQGESIVRRNCCYDIEVNINDLQDKNLQYKVSAAKWEMPFDN